MLNKNSAIKSALCGVTLSLLTMSAHAVVLDDDATTSSNAASINQSGSAFGVNQIVVKYKDNAVQSQNGIFANSSVQMMSKSMGAPMELVRTTGTGAAVYKMPEAKLANMSVGAKQVASTNIDTLLAELNADPNVEWAAKDDLLQAMATPNDPQYNNMWHYFESTGGLNLPSAWDVTSGAGVVVAVLDTGITSHPDLNGNLLPGYDMISRADIGNDGNGRDSDPSDTGDATVANECGPNSPPQDRDSSWHGTHVAGTMSAVGNNNTGIAGVAYSSKFVPVRVLGKCGGLSSDIADGIIWAAGGSVPGVPANPNPAKVINLSLGGGGSCNPISQAAINQAVSLGATVVVAAGNSNANASDFTPASCQNVISVASTNRNGSKAFYSNFGNVVDLAAPGGDVRTSRSDGVLSTLNSGRNGPATPNYEYYQGTSMAAPHVAGAAALLYAVKSDITPAEVESILKSTTRSFPGSCSGCGAGIVDAAAAVAAANPGSGGGNPGNDSVLENGVAKTGLSGGQGSETRFTLQVPAGASGLSFAISGGSGDADLYVRFGSAPTTGTYDCRPFRNGNNETCNISNVQAGTYHVMIRGYSAFSGVSLVASFTEPSSGNPGGPETATQTNISGSRNQWVDYQWEVDAGRSNLTISISGGTGDADLYVLRGSQPTTSSYDCRPFRNGNNETCTFNNPAPGTYFIRLRGYTNFSGVTLTATQE